MDFDTAGGGGGGGGFSGARGGRPPGGDLFGGDTGRPDDRGSGGGNSSSWWVRFFGGGPPDYEERRRRAEARANGAAFRIPGGARKDVLVSLAVAVWKAQVGFDPKAALAEVRGHDIPRTEEGEAKLVRALSRSSMGVIENAIGAHVRNKHVVALGHLGGSARTALERLGADVEELAIEDEKRYIDMTPLIFVVAAVAMGARYISLGLDDKQLYILAGLVFALMYGLRPFFFKMQRPQGS